jgi:hypothetical protein
MSKYYVTMTDKFMSGWGLAEKKVNKMIVECNSYEQALQIKSAAQKRSEMRRVNIRATRPSYESHIFPSWKTFDDLTGPWKE